MRKTFLLSLCLGLLAGSALAEPAPMPAHGPTGLMTRDTMPHTDHEGRPNESFQQFKAEQLRRHEAHLHILQRGTTCLRQAQVPDALRACMESQHREMEALREAFRPPHGDRAFQPEWRP